MDVWEVHGDAQREALKRRHQLEKEQQNHNRQCYNTQNPIYVRGHQEQGHPSQILRPWQL